MIQKALTQQESREIEKQVELMNQQEMILMALKTHFRAYLMSSVLTRLQIPLEMADKVVFDLSTGILQYEEEKKETKKEDISRKP